MKKIKLLAAIPAIFVVLLVLVILSAIGAFVASSAGKITGFMTISQTVKEDAGIQVYFCRDDNVSCSQKFANVIDNADQYVYCAFYSLGIDNVKNALNSKNITVKVVLDKNNYVDLDPPAKMDLNPALMHNNFCVTDKEIITGSFNPTLEEELYDDNNIVISNSSYLRENYIQEFYQLYDGNVRKTPYPKIIIGNITVENYFCPKDGCEKHILSSLDNANTSIKFMTFSFTSNPIGDLLIKKQKFGVNVSGVFETLEDDRWSQKNKLAVNAGCDVVFDGNPKLMNHKVFLIDNSVVITGSYDPTVNANIRNDENILIIYDDAIANKYMNEFDRVWNMSSQ